MYIVCMLFVLQTSMFAISDQAYTDALSYLPEGGYGGISCRISRAEVSDEIPQYIRVEIKKRRPSPFDSLLDLDGENFRYHLLAQQVDYEYVELSSPIYDDLSAAMVSLKKRYPNYHLPVWHVTGENREVTVVGYFSRTAQNCFVVSVIDARMHLARKYEEGAVDRLEEALNKHHIYTFKPQTGSEDSLYLSAMEPDLIIAAENLAMLRRMAAASMGEDPGVLSQRDYLAPFEHIPDDAIHFSIGFNFEIIAMDKELAERADTREDRKEHTLKYGSGGPLYSVSALTAGKQLILRSVQCFEVEELAIRKYARMNQVDERSYAAKSELTKQVIKIQEQNTTMTRDGRYIFSEKVIDQALIKASDAAQEEILKAEKKKKQR